MGALTRGTRKRRPGWGGVFVRCRWLVASLVVLLTITRLTSGPGYPVGRWLETASGCSRIVATTPKRAGARNRCRSDT